MASKFMEGIALGEPSFTFPKGLFLGLLILSLLPGPSVSSSANSLPAAEGEGSGIHGFGVTWELAGNAELQAIFQTPLSQHLPFHKTP